MRERAATSRDEPVNVVCTQIFFQSCIASVRLSDKLYDTRVSFTRRMVVIATDSRLPRSLTNGEESKEEGQEEGKQEGHQEGLMLFGLAAT